MNASANSKGSSDVMKHGTARTALRVNVHGG